MGIQRIRRFWVAMVLILVCILPLSAFAERQWYAGFSGGYVYSMLETGTGYRENTAYVNGHGFSVSTHILYQINSHLGLESGMTYAARPYGWSHWNTYGDETERQRLVVDNYFLEFPLSLYLMFGNEAITATLSIGGYAGIWMASHQEGEINSFFYASDGHVINIPFDEWVQFSDVRDNRLDGGLLVRSGIVVETGGFNLFFHGSFQLSLTDLSKPYQLNLVSRYSHALVVEAGALVTLGGSR